MKQQRLTAILLALILCLSASFAGADVILDQSHAVFPQNSGVKTTADVYPEPFSANTVDDELEIWFGRVNVCDCMVVRCHGETMMIDGGTRGHGAATRAFLRALNVTHVNYIFNTHHHDDHIEIQISLVSRGELTADTFLTPYPRGYNVELQKQMEATVDKAGIEYRQVFDGDEIYLGGEDGALLQFYRWDGSTDANYSSMICKITYRQRSILLMADVIGKAQKQLGLERTDINWDADILKAGHHGYSKQDTNLLSMITPDLVVIMNTGMSETAQQMKKLEIPYVLTTVGAICAWTDGGDNWYYNQERADLPR